MEDKELIDLANKMEEQYGRDGVTLTAEDYEKVKHPELPKHDAKQAMEQYIKAMHDTEGIDWDKVIANAEAAQANEISAGAMTKQIAMRGEERRKRFESLKDELRDFRPEITYPPTISNNIPMPVDGGYEDSDNSHTKGFDDFGL